MSNLKELPFSALQFYATAPYPCSYLNDRPARSQVATPAHLINADVYSELVRMGFRRSGIFTYRPLLRWLPRLRPGARARRGVRAEAAISVAPWPPIAVSLPRVVQLAFDQEHYELYLRYQSTRHAGGGMDNDSREQYSQFLLQSNVNTRLVEFRDPYRAAMPRAHRPAAHGVDHRHPQRRAVVGVHLLRPDRAGASFGTFNVLWQIEQARALSLPYLYLGYWIEHSPKMAYKANFRPIEVLRQGRWQSLP